jgi:hypothetical protein
LLSKVREGIIVSFQVRVAKYDQDIRQLDSFRGTSQLQFSKLFLVKESLALMYQMLQLPGEALVQYEDLEALLAFAPIGVISESDWPWTFSDSTSLQTKGDESSPASQIKGVDIIPTKDILATVNDGWIGACRNGDNVLVYSMNNARTRILRNQISIWELYRYVMAREFYFLLQLNKPYGFCEKGYNFIGLIRGLIERKLNESELYPKSAEKLDGQSIEKILIQIKRQQADIWAIASSIKITRACFDALRPSGKMDFSHSEKFGIPSSSPQNSMHAIVTNGIIWDDLNIPCLIHLSELLRYASFKLIQLLEGERKYQNEVYELTNSFTHWDSLNETKLAFPSWTITLPQVEGVYGESLLDLNPASTESVDNRSFGIEEVIYEFYKMIGYVCC